MNNSVAVQLSVYPNPVSDIINITHPVADQYSSINIFDLSGKLILKSPVETGTSSSLIKVNEIPSDIYVVSFEKSNYKSALKFIKK